MLYILIFFTCFNKMNVNVNQIIEFDDTCDIKDILKSLREYNRVLKKNGKVIIFTVGPSHDIFKKAKLYGKNQYEVQNWDFRNGEKYFYFESEKYLKFYSSKFFKNIETGRVRENLMKINLDFLILTGNK